MYVRLHNITEESSWSQRDQPMKEYSRILIEEYCITHVGTKKSSFLWELVELSYDLGYEPEDWQAVRLEQYISREKDPELKQALEDLDDYLFCY